MATLNKVMLIGRLTDNPEPPRTLPNSGSTVVKFRFAVSRNKKNPQTGQWENDPNPLYIDCEAFAYPDARRNLVDLISRYCQKGSQLYIEGRLQYDVWDDKNNPGQKRSKHKVVVDSLEFLGQPPGGGGGGDSAGGESGGYDNRNRAPARPPANDFDDAPAQSEGDIPF
jgi:single-strand DNA-binding protein